MDYSERKICQVLQRHIVSRGQYMWVRRPLKIYYYSKSKYIFIL